MQAISQQAATTQPMPEIQPATPFRPEPFVPEHLSPRREAAFAGEFGDRHPGLSTREGLAAAFRNMGAGSTQRSAYERVKDFYRATGHAWARALGRDSC